MKTEKQIFESGFEAKKEATDAEVDRRIKEQRDFELRKLTPGEVPGTLAGLLSEFFTEHGAKSLARKTLQRYREMAEYLDNDLHHHHRRLRRRHHHHQGQKQPPPPLFHDRRLLVILHHAQALLDHPFDAPSAEIKHLCRNFLRFAG